MAKLWRRESPSKTRAMAGRRESKCGTEVLRDMHVSCLSAFPNPEQSLREEACPWSIRGSAIPAQEDSALADWAWHLRSLRKSCLASAVLNALPIIMKNKNVGLVSWNLASYAFLRF